MGRHVDRLSARFVQTVKTPGRHADGAGLYLVVDPSLAKRWAFIFQWQGKRKELGLGSASLVGLADAREAALDARKAVAAGRNPIEERRLGAGPAAKTFGDVADSVLAALEGDWSNEVHKRQWHRSLEVVSAPLRPLAVDAVSTADVLAVLKPIWTKTPESASRLRGRIERVLDAAKAKGLRTGENPARWRGHLDNLLSRKRKLVKGHHAALPYEELPGFIWRLRAQEGVGARALEATILTIARTGETIGAQWPEIDQATRLWTVPPERMKGRREHRVPLTDAAWAVFEAMLPLADRDAAGKPVGYIFPGAVAGEPLSNMAMLMTLRRLGEAKATVHGMRSTFRDWAGDRTAFAREVVEAALAHRVGNQTELAYRRSDAIQKRRKLLEAWAGYCARAVGDNVAPFMRPAAGGGAG